MGRKKKVSYNFSTEEEAQQASALEDFLFGGSAAGKLLATAGADAGASIAELVKQAEAAASSDDADDDGEQDLLFVEDRLGDDDADADAMTPDDDADAVEDGGSSDGDDEPRQQQQGEAGPGPGSMALQQQQQERRQRATKRGRAPVWVDPADAAVSVPVAAVARLRKLRQYKGQSDMSGEQYEAALRRQHTILNPRTNWAAKPAGPSSKAAAAAGAGGDYAAIDDEREPDESSAQQLLLSGSGLLLQRSAASGGVLAPGSIELSRLRDANGSSPSDAVVQALQFHPNGQLMLTAGFDKRLKLFQVDGLRNPLVQSLFLEDCPIHTAAFAAGGSCVVAAGRRPFYYVADLNTGQLERVVTPPCINLAPSGAPSNKPAFTAAAAASGGSKPSSSKRKGSSRGTGSKGGAGMKSCESFVVSPESRSQPLVAFLGDNGHIGLVSLGSRSSVGSLKMNGSARAAAFSSDGNTLVTAGGDGVVYTWDMRSQRCLHQQRDEGVVSCTSLALSPDGSYLATGDSMGVVNIYNRPAGLLAPLLGGADVGGGGGGGAAAAAAGVSGRAATPAPLKTLMNLTTAVDSLAFSHDSQVLLMGSRLNKESLRLLHVPSLTVFQNWPTSKSPLQYVHCAGFSPHSGFLGVGNAKGRVLLYRLHHYLSV